MSEEYDNTFTGAVFPTEEYGIMAGPFDLPNGRKGRVILERNAMGKGLHALRIHRVRRDQSLGQQLYEGVVRKNRTAKDNAPMAIGYISNGKSKRIEICLWLKSDLVDYFYQIKIDKLRTQRTGAFEL